MEVGFPFLVVLLERFLVPLGPHLVPHFTLLSVSRNGAIRDTLKGTPGDPKCDPSGTTIGSLWHPWVPFGAQCPSFLAPRFFVGPLWGASRCFGLLLKRLFGLTRSRSLYAAARTVLGMPHVHIGWQ